MKRTPKKPRLERRRLEDLVDHPRQQHSFRRLPEHKLKRMAQAALKNCLPPIEILPANNRAGLPAGTILRGHMRKLAHQLNGTTEVDVLVRHDLIDADEATVEREFIVENHDRRHDDILTLARNVLRLYELERNGRGKLSGSEEAEARDRIGKEIGMSGRNLQRYWNILKTPVEVQNAVSDRRLRLVDAERVARLDDDAKAEIARRIQLGEEPKEVVGAYLPAAEDRKWGGGDAVVGVLRALRSLLRCARGPQDHFRRERLASHIAFFEEAQEVLAGLLARATLGAGKVENIPALGGGEE